MRDVFVLVSMPGSLVTHFLPVSVRVLAASRIHKRLFKLRDLALLTEVWR